MSLYETLTQSPILDDGGNITLSRTEAMKVLLSSKTDGESIVDMYFKSVVLPCGTIFTHGLQKLQEESKQRLGYKVSGNWENTLREQVTWHDAVLWLMLVDLSEDFEYQPMHEELEIMQSVYKVCTEKEPQKFKSIYGILNLPL